MMSEERLAVSVEDVRHVADLANLELTAEELPRMARDLNAVLGYIAQMNELDTSAVEPMAQVGQALGLKAAVGGRDAAGGCGEGFGGSGGGDGGGSGDGWEIFQGAEGD